MEEWRPIPGFERYLVSNEGRVAKILGIKVKNKKEHLCLTPNASGRPGCEYQSARLYRDGKSHKRLIHKLVFEAFMHEVPFGYQVDHLDHDRDNNHLSNLECVTYEENMRRRRKKPATPRDPELERILDEAGINI